MTIDAVDWTSLSDLPGPELQGRVFALLQRVARLIQTRAIDDPVVLEAVPRLAELMARRHADLLAFREIFGALAGSVGLWNYIDKDTVDTREQLIAENAAVGPLGIVLHREQFIALNMLVRGSNLILSAPTSFGKSILIDALLLHEKYRRVAIVVPTIALLDECRRRLVARFGNTFDIIMHHSERPAGKRVVFIGTQERLIGRDDLGHLDLVVVDEFYKLDPSRRDDRSVILNAAVYRLLSCADQFFFLGPNIETVRLADDSRWRFEFLKTRFATVAVDTFDLRAILDKEARLFEEMQASANWPALVFVSSPDRANKLGIAAAERGLALGAGSELATWMGENYGQEWPLVDAVRAGVGVHHGRIPRALAARFVALFNREVIPVLLCTSTLIEGVNTAAKSVLIFDKTIARRNYDFFTFANIRGRAGRLGHHHTGRVFLFHDSPSAENVEVVAPLFGDPDDAPDELVVYLTGPEASRDAVRRVDGIASRIGLAPDEVRRFAHLGIDVLESLREATNGELRESPGALSWVGWPQYEAIKALSRVVCAAKKPGDFGCRSASQLALYIGRLRSEASMHAFHLWHAGSYRGAPEQFDGVFKFLRAAEYGLPEYFGVVELFVRRAGVLADYGLFLAALPRWFRPEELKILEEQGVPMQISERFLVDGDTVESLQHRLRESALRSDGRLSGFEREWILEALPGV